MSKLPVAIQLFGLRDLLGKTPENFPEVMRQVKELGYDGVELAGLYGLTPAEVKAALDEAGLVAISAHVPLVEMLADPHKTAADYKSIGCRWIVVPYLPEDLRPGTQGYEDLIAKLPELGRIMKEAGLELLYHNHDFEFVTMPDGSFGFDDMYNRVPADLLKTEQDTCWVKVAGQDPVAYLQKYAGRAPVVHLKDFIMRGNPRNKFQLLGIEETEKEPEQGYFAFRPVGFGQQIWEPILDAAVEAGAQWVVVEQDDHYELTAIEAARRSREYLRILGW